MRIQEEITKQSLAEAVRTYKEDRNCFKALGITKCFQIAALLVDDIKEHIPELNADQAYPVVLSSKPHNIVTRQVRLLERVVGAVEHSAYYHTFLNHSRVLTTVLIANHHELVEAIYSSDELTITDWKSAAEEAHKCQVEASQMIVDNMFPWADIEFKETPIKWFQKPKHYTVGGASSAVHRGTFISDIKSNNRIVQLNLHEDADLGSSIINTMSVIHHETIHDQGFQVGRLCYEGRAIKAGELVHDGEIWRAISEAEAYIPCGISTAYHAQCIERVAYQQQALFDKHIQKIFSIPLLQVACT